jgi:hypothetical protein
MWIRLVTVEPAHPDERPAASAQKEDLPVSAPNESSEDDDDGEVEFYLPNDESLTLDDVAVHDSTAAARGEGNYRFESIHFNQLYDGTVNQKEEGAKLVFAYAFRMKGTQSHNSREYVVNIPLRQYKNTNSKETQNVVVHVHYANNITKGDDNDTGQSVQNGECIVSGVNIRLLTKPESRVPWAVNHINDAKRFPRIYLDDKEIQADRFRFKATGGYKWCVDKLGKKRLVSMGRRWRQGSRVFFERDSSFGEQCMQPTSKKTFWEQSGKNACKRAICDKIVHELQSVKPKIKAGWKSERGYNLHKELFDESRLELKEPQQGPNSHVVVEVWIDWEGVPVELQVGFMERLMEDTFKDEVNTAKALVNYIKGQGTGSRSIEEAKIGEFYKSNPKAERVILKEWPRKRTLRIFVDAFKHLLQRTTLEGKKMISLPLSATAKVRCLSHFAIASVSIFVVCLNSSSMCTYPPHTNTTAPPPT